MRTAMIITFTINLIWMAIQMVCSNTFDVDIFNACCGWISAILVSINNNQ